MLDSRARSFAVLTVLLLFGTIAAAQPDTAWARRVYDTGNGDDENRVAIPGAELDKPEPATTLDYTLR